MMNKCIVLVVVFALEVSAGNWKCGHKAPHCKIDRNGNFIWDSMRVCPAAPICNKDESLVVTTVKGRRFCCCKDSESPATTEPPYCEPRACGRGKFWRPAPYCSCWVGCDFIRECAQGLKWDIFVCGCIEACPDTKCRKNFIPDAETCECQCSLSSSDCSDGTTFDPLNCRCVSNPTTTPGCPHVVTCPKGKHWDESVCDCVKDENCKVQACGKPKVWSPELCKCVCSPKSCGKGKVQGSDCECVPEIACPDIECFENFVLNPQSCECDCALTDEDCTGPLAYLDFNSCQCRRHPCDPPWPCPEGEIIDWEICNCAPDPNLTTKIPKSRESKSRENSKKSRESRSWRSSSDENRS